MVRNQKLYFDLSKLFKTFKFITLFMCLSNMGFFFFQKICYLMENSNQLAKMTVTHQCEGPMELL